MENPQSAPQTVDSLDKLARTIRENLASIIKTAPAVIGFSLFLIYFCENQFFPSFDLFSLGSLLIAASVLGLIVFTTLTIGVSAPGLMWIDIFLKDKDVRDEFEYELSKESKKRSKQELEIIRTYFFLPAMLCAFTYIHAILSEISYAVYLFAAPLGLCVVLAISLRLKYHLSTSSLVKYVLASLTSYSVASVTSLLFVVFFLKARFPTEPDHIQILIAVALTLLMITAFTICAISFHNLKHSHTIFFSMLFAFTLSIFSNTWIMLPGGIAKILGIGNYIASEINASGKACKIQSIPWQSHNEELCKLTNTKVVWSLGDTYRLRIQNKDIIKDISISATDIVSLIKETTPEAPK